MHHNIKYNIPKWDKRFLELAEYISTWSKDESTKVGCVIVGPNREIRSIGYNGLPRYCKDNVDKRHKRPLKYKWFEHATRNAIYNAASFGAPLNDCTMYTQFYPCCDCARAIVQSGILELVTWKPDWEHERWGDDFKIVHEMLNETNVEVVLYEK